jgi:hypothetical protein
MAGLFRHTPETPEGKYLVKRRDGSIPQWPFFVLAASDPAAPFAIRCYADKCESLGMDMAYVQDLKRLADEFEQWRLSHGAGDPDAPRHRTDDPATVAEMRKGFGA